MIALFAMLALVSDPESLFPAKPTNPLMPVPAPVTLAKLSDYRSRCQGITLLTANEARARLSKLGDLPDADMEIAIDRAMGCRALPLVIRYKVSR